MRWPHWEQFITHPLVVYMGHLQFAAEKSTHTHTHEVGRDSHRCKHKAPLCWTIFETGCLVSISAQCPLINLRRLCLFMCASMYAFGEWPSTFIKRQWDMPVRSRSQWNAADRVRVCVFEYKLAALANDAPRDWWPPDQRLTWKICFRENSARRSSRLSEFSSFS